jgi:integrator complex subunit 3
VAVVHTICAVFARFLSAAIACRFFPAKPNDTLLVDLVRYVCCVFHPNNKLLQSQVVPRWFMLGWLVSLWSVRSCCTHLVLLLMFPGLIACVRSSKTPQAAFAFRAALVYDWLGYDDKKSVMYVEPAMLMMMRALPKYTDVVAGVLDALVTVTKGYADWPASPTFLVLVLIFVVWF